MWFIDLLFDDYELQALIYESKRFLVQYAHKYSILINTHKLACIRAHTNTYTLTITSACSRMHANTNMCMYTYKCVCVCAHTHTHTEYVEGNFYHPDKTHGSELHSQKSFT